MDIAYAVFLEGRRRRHAGRVGISRFCGRSCARLFMGNEMDFKKCSKAFTKLDAIRLCDFSIFEGRTSAAWNLGYRRKNLGEWIFDLLERLCLGCGHIFGPEVPFFAEYDVSSFLMYVAILPKYLSLPTNGILW